MTDQSTHIYIEREMCFIWCEMRFMSATNRRLKRKKLVTYVDNNDESNITNRSIIKPA